MHDLIERQAAIDAHYEYCNKHSDAGFPVWSLKILEDLPSAQPEPCGDVVSRNAIVQKLNEMDRYVSTELRLCDTDKKFPQNEVFIVDDVYEEIVEQLPSVQPETHEERTETHSCDCISRQAAINALTSHIMPHNNEDGTVTIGVLSKSSIKNILNKLPSAQPEHTNSCYTNSWCIDCKEYDTENKCCPRYNRVIKQTLDEVYAHAETEAEARYHAEIIACGDCKHWICHDRRCGYWNHGVRAIDWCSHAERRTDG